MAVSGYIGIGSGEYAASPAQGSWSVLMNEEKTYWGASHRAIIKWTDIVAIANSVALAANTALTIGLVAVPAGTAATALGQPTGVGQLVQCDFARLVTPFANGANAAQNTTAFTVGDNESATQYLASMETNYNGAYAAMKMGTSTASAKVYTAADVLQAVIGAPGAGLNLSNLTQGELHVFFRVRDNTLPG